MAKARQEGRKKQTRRVMNPQPEVTSVGGLMWPYPGIRLSHSRCVLNNGMVWDDSPYGKIGDKLYTREEHYLYGNWQKDGLTKTGKQKWKFVPDGDTVLFSDDNPIYFKISMDKESPEKKQWYKRLARFMPKKYARDFPTITGIRAERLLDISEEDAILEGVEFYQPTDRIDVKLYKDYFPQQKFNEGKAVQKYPFLTAKRSFASLIQMLHGPEILQENPWCWVLEIE